MKEEALDKSRLSIQDILLERQNLNKFKRELDFESTLLDERLARIAQHEENKLEKVRNKINITRL